MSVYVLTPRAKADIFDIWSHIADDNEDADQIARGEFIEEDEMDARIKRMFESCDVSAGRPSPLS